MNEETISHRFKSVRLRHYQYTEPGAYFVTLVTSQRESIFGRIDDGTMIASSMGSIVIEEWLRTADMRPRVELDCFCLMPNHFHGILTLKETVRAHSSAPLRQPTLPRRWNERPADSLSSIIAGFKAATTRRINTSRNRPGAEVWQHRFYEHVVRGDRDLEQIREYIVNNPLRWELDRENPERNETS